MYIREITKRNKGYAKTFTYHRLVESVRTPKGPRLSILLDLGRLDIPKQEWKTLANRIEEIITGQASFIAPAEYIESLAQHYAAMLRQKEMHSVPDSKTPEWETVDLGSLSQSEFRTVGGETVAHWAFKELGMDQILRDTGLNQKQIDQAALLMIGRMLHPGSERETAAWGTHTSALGEILDTDFRHLSNNALYRVSDELVRHREEIETALAERERQAYGLKEKILLYDLSNTYLTGPALGSDLAQLGNSKEKRSDCPLLTLALVLDEDGFPKASKVLAGNTPEPSTLEGFLRAYKDDLRQRLPLFRELPTVVVDAGIGTKDNLDLIRGEGFSYITVRRSRSSEMPEGELRVINERKEATIEAMKLEGDGGEVILYCRSSGRLQKEASIKSRLQKHYEEGLEHIAASIGKKRGAKRYEKVLERLGRLRERYPTIARFYRVEVSHEGQKATGMKWEIEKEKELEARFSGSYYLRTNRTDLDGKELWSLYMMLGRVEDSFRALKSELGLRPVYHQKDFRMEAHLFISVLAYHLMTVIRRKLYRKGIGHSWNTIRDRMATHMRATASITNDRGERLHLRQTGDPESRHLEIYKALGIPPRALPTKRLKV